jgi:hypothetical protein
VVTHDTSTKLTATKIAIWFVATILVVTAAAGEDFTEILGGDI